MKKPVIANKTTEYIDLKNIDKLVPKEFLPKMKMSAEYVFVRENDFFVYPNNYNHFVNYYGNTFQHGGISLEEILIPFIVLGKR